MKKPLTELQLRFLDLLFDDERKLSPREAATEAGYSLRSPITCIMEGLTDEILSRVEGYLAVHAPKSVAKIVQVLDQPYAPGAKNVLAAAQMLLDRAGLVKREKIEIQHTMPNGILILPAKED